MSTQRIALKILGISGLALSAALLLFLVFAYSCAPDVLTAVTFFPAWMWLLPGIALCALCTLYKPRFAILAGVLWLLFAIFMVDQTRCIMRGVFTGHDINAPRSKDTIRVISLNCAGASLAAAREAIAYKPDILMLTESPSRSDVNNLAIELFGPAASITWDREATIIAKGPVTPRTLDRKSSAFMTHARVELQPGISIEVINARLLPTYIGMNLFSPYNWRMHLDNRRDHSRQVAMVLDSIKSSGIKGPIIFGGDLNVVANDGALKSLKPFMRDCATKAAIGWPDTAPNEISLVRIDQLWATRDLEPVSLWTVKSCNSDHRFLVCDFIFSGGKN